MKLSIRRLFTGLIASTALASGLMVTTSAPADASEHQGLIARSETLDRAQNWVNRSVTYTQDMKVAAPDVDGAHAYRRDCSGLVAMAWHYGSSPRTNDFLSMAQNNNGMHVISRDDLRAGDAMVRDNDGAGNDGHMELFSHWVNGGDHSQGAYVYSFNNNGQTVENPYANNNVGNLGKNSNSEMQTYTAIRYNKIVEAMEVGHSAPAVGSWGTSKLNMVVRGTDNRAYHRWINPNGTWTPWESIGDNLASAPAVAWWASDRFIVFSQFTDGRIRSREWTPAGWGGWEDVTGNGTLTSGPSVAVIGTRLYMFARGTDSDVHYRTRDLGAGWTPWARVGGNAGSSIGAPGVAAFIGDQIQLVVRGTDNSVYSKYFIKSSGFWSDWTNLGGTIFSSPSVVELGNGAYPRQLGVFAHGTNDRPLQRNWTEGIGWESNFQVMDGNGFTSSAVGAARWGAQTFIVIRGTDGHPYGRLYNPDAENGEGAWTSWSMMDGSIA